MNRVLMVGATEELQSLAQALEKAGLPFEAAPATTVTERLHSGEAFGALVLNLLDGPDGAHLSELLDAPMENRPAIVGIVRRDHVADLDPALALDDFVTFPALPEEFVLRIRRALAARGEVEDPNVLKRGDLTIDHTSYKVFVGSRPVELTYKEYELLRFLALNEGKVCTREMLLSRVWGYDFYGGARTVDVHIRRLRSKIEDRHHTLIETVRNVGYRFRPS
jgi:two-component system alkaline phosphatase synthesis response regulator PhoP